MTNLAYADTDVWEVVDPDTGRRFLLPIIEAPSPSNDTVVTSSPKWEWLSEKEKDIYRTQALFKVYNSPDKRRLHNHEEVIEATAKLIFYGEE